MSVFLERLCVWNMLNCAQVAEGIKPDILQPEIIAHISWEYFLFLLNRNQVNVKITWIEFRSLLSKASNNNHDINRSGFISSASISDSGFILSTTCASGFIPSVTCASGFIPSATCASCFIQSGTCASGFIPSETWLPVLSPQQSCSSGFIPSASICAPWFCTLNINLCFWFYPLSINLCFWFWSLCFWF